MSSNNQIALTPSMSKRPTSRKNRVVRTYSQTKLPSLLSKSSVFLSATETTHIKRYHSQKKDALQTTVSSSMNNLQTRLPPLNTTSNDDFFNKKQRADFQRRQIYALNHLMRELEQEKFREYCQMNGIGVESTSNDEEETAVTEDVNKQSETTS